MATCAVSVVLINGNASVTVLSPTADPASSCSGAVLLSPSEYGDLKNASSIYSWDSEAFSYGVSSVVLMFCIGFGIGLIINLVRKAR